MTCEFLLHEKNLNLKNDNIFNINDQIKVSRIPFCIGYCYQCMDCHLKLHLGPFIREYVIAFLRNI